MNRVRRWLTKAVFGLGLAGWHGQGGALGSPSGKVVSVDGALQLSAVYACVSLIAQTIATLPLMVYRDLPDGGRSVDTTHSLYSLLHDQPNADQSSVEFWEQVVSCVLLHGNAYARIDRNALGDAISLTPMSPDRVSVQRDPDGRLAYVHQPGYGPPETYPDDAVLHIKGWSLTGLIGLSVVSYARSSMGIALAAEEAAGSFFKNGLSASGFVETGGAVLTQPQRDQFNARMAEFRGSGNSGKTILLEGPFKYSSLAMKPEDAQLLASREFGVSEIARWFRVPEWMIGHHSKSSSWGSGLEQQMLAFLQFTLRPWLTRIEQRIKISLVKPSDRSRITVEFNVEGLLRADSAARAALYSVQAQNALASRNEIRRRENLPSVEGGDIMTVQSNLMSLADVGKVAAEQTPAGFGLPSARNQPQDEPATHTLTLIKQ